MASSDKFNAELAEALKKRRESMTPKGADPTGGASDSSPESDANSNPIRIRARTDPGASRHARHRPGTPPSGTQSP